MPEWLYRFLMYVGRHNLLGMDVLVMELIMFDLERQGRKIERREKRRNQRRRAGRLALLVIPRTRRDEIIGDFNELADEVKAMGAGRVARLLLVGGRFLLYARAIFKLRLPDFSAADSKENESERERETR